MTCRHTFGMATLFALVASLLATSVTAIKFGNPMSYVMGQPVPLRVNSLTSVSKVMPMEWYSMPWCAPSKADRKKFRNSQNLGEILWGDQVEISLFNVETLNNVSCAKLCDPILNGDKEKALLTKRVEENYRGNLILDGLPVAEEGSGKKSRISKSVATGFPLGVPKKATGTGKTMIHNHLAFIIQYHPQPQAETGIIPGFDDDVDTYRIVGFSVTPMSVDHATVPCNEKFDAENAPPVFTTADEMTWSYSIKWEESDVEWSTRWDVYMKSSAVESRIHWFSILNSLLIVFLLSAMIGFILIRALRRDLARYNDPEAIQEERDETGWKLIHGDVFRKPEGAGLLAVCVGSGMQLFGMTLTAIIFAAFGFVSPANRGSLIVAMIFLFVLLGSWSGYTTARMAKLFKMKSWKIIFVAGVFFPGQMFLGYFLLNFVHWGNHAASATPITAMLTLAALWMCVSVPLVLLGGAIGYRHEEITLPTKVNSIPRSIPPQPWYLEYPWAAIIPGVLPFGAAFIESVFILGSVWQGRVYYVFGFLALVFVIVLVTCAEATIVLIYFQLVNLDYRWWWKSYVASGSYGLWLFAYSIFYYSTALTIRSWWSSVLYYGYMLMISYFFFIMTGAVGFVAAFLFVRAIYGSIKVE
jgi:transmembrane 9 superfamily member 2/4